MSIFKNINWYLLSISNEAVVSARLESTQDGLHVVQQYSHTLLVQVLDVIKTAPTPVLKCIITFFCKIYWI